MFAKIAKFFIENWKLTFVLIIITVLSWVWSYLVIPKQYNPTIIVPAFSVMVPASWLSSQEVSDYIISPLENKIMELEWIDEVYGTAWENFWAVMVKFTVWEDSEDAKIKLQQKLSENMWLKPIWVESPIVTKIDPESLPQITYAISYDWDDLSESQKYIYLRQIANIVKDDLKVLDNITTIDIVWWYKNNLNILLDLEIIESKNLDILQIYDVLSKNNINTPVWTIHGNNWKSIAIDVEAKGSTIEYLEQIIISKNENSIIYLNDIADISFGVDRISHTSSFNGKTAVFIWFWKQTGSNGVFLTESVISKIEKTQQKLPKNISFTIIQNEWQTAKDATNMLLINLATSVFIVFLVLAFYLWRKDAFNTAISIPLTLGLVFLIALFLGENINRITLFALILVLWMLVDNSTVVVENISRHLSDREKTGKTKLDAVLTATNEVWTWVILSTLSRLLAFWAMFAVWGMMGEYMWPIPKFAILALFVSVIIAFTINPWLSYIWAKDITQSSSQTEKKAKKSFDIRKYYLAFMQKFFSKDKKAKERRRLFKITFWVALFVILVWPIYTWIFKARMLPKSNQDQVYVWIDAPRWWNTTKMQSVESDLVTFFTKSWSHIPEELQIVENISITSGQAFIWDFANLFRWGMQRVNENQLSARINLFENENYEKDTGKQRMISEDYSILIRPYLNDYLLQKYPDLQLRLLEDPPGPPVRATFLAKIKSDAADKQLWDFIRKVESNVRNIWSQESIVDIWNSLSTTYRKIRIDIDTQAVILAWLNTQQVTHSLWIILSWLPIELVSDSESLEATNLILTVPHTSKDSLEVLNTISFTNPEWKKIFLKQIADIEYSFVWSDIYTDKREQVNYIYWEMWDNSLVYPMITLFKELMSESFLQWEYELLDWSPYQITYKWVSDGKIYKIEWGWEWELTMDTFRDLGIAMWLSLLAIYFLLVWQFASFRIAGIIMITFLLSFYGVFPWFSFLYLLQNEYFSATSMIWIIALGWIVVWNAIILIDYINVLKRNGLTIEDALLKAGYVRFAPIILTSLTTVFWAATIIWDPVWSGLAWSIIWWLLLSSILTLIVIPIFYYESQKDDWDKCMEYNSVKNC